MQCSRAHPPSTSRTHHSRGALLIARGDKQEAIAARRVELAAPSPPKFAFRRLCLVKHKGGASCNLHLLARFPGNGMRCYGRVLTSHCHSCSGTGSERRLWRRRRFSQKHRAGMLRCCFWQWIAHTENNRCWFQENNSNGFLQIQRAW